MQNKKGGESRDIKIIIDTNKHGIRREYPAAGYKATAKMNKRKKHAKKEKEKEA